MRLLKSWDKFDEKMKARATEELLRFMTMFSTAAALVCFRAAFLRNSATRTPLILLVFMMIFSFSCQHVKRKNENRWGVAKRTGREVFRIGMTQPTEEERMGIKSEPEKKAKKKKKPAKKGNYKH